MLCIEFWCLAGLYDEADLFSGCWETLSPGAKWVGQGCTNPGHLGG